MPFFVHMIMNSIIIILLARTAIAWKIVCKAHKGRSFLKTVQ